MAFQPIVDVVGGGIFAYEALVRGPTGEGAEAILAAVTPEQRYAFDQKCRVTAIREAVKAGIGATSARLAINFMPDVISDPMADSEATLEAAKETGLPPERLIFEFSGLDRLDSSRMADTISAYRRMGMMTSFDDFDSHADGLGLLGRFTPDMIKLNPQLVRNLSSSWSRRLIVEKIATVTHRLGIRLVAEGVENRSDSDKLRSLGIRYQQGYHIARPAVGRLPRPFSG
ncbi:EAL domain-containing protein [Sphingosinithalassobacter tenebrarum]|uniref:EAL domain-containing protein n=2 Tax=Stakelama tenebrarum TaxID=2711215 RepID=A0A6G6YA08_9SPHN|nr:EAL domain-containing protein [Sphingosinithalassobacter tenebrarum]